MTVTKGFDDDDDDDDDGDFILRQLSPVVSIWRLPHKRVYLRDRTGPW